MTVCYGLGGGRLPEDTTNKRHWNIANLIPVFEAKIMTCQHWKDQLELEQNDLPCDYYVDHVKGLTTIFGVKQPNVTRQHRQRIVNWMSEACSLFQWTSQSFFTSVHAWDAYITHVSHVISPTELPKLSAACLYFGAELLESAADDGIKTLGEFTNMCPEAGSVEDLKETQAHLIDTLQGMSLARRTPLDFLLLYLAQLQLIPSPGPELFESLLHRGLLDLIWDLSLNVSLVIYSNGLILDGLPASRWVAVVLLRVLEFLSPELRTHSTYQRSLIMRTVFHVSENEELFTSPIIDQILQCVWAHTKNKDFSEYAENSDEPSCSIIKHRLPKGFSQWSITEPSHKTVQRVSMALRNSRIFLDSRFRKLQSMEERKYDDEQEKKKKDLKEFVI